MRKIKQLSLVLFIFSVLAFSYPLTQVFAQGGGQCDSNPACDPTSGTCCNQCDSNPACVTSDLNAIPCCSNEGMNRGTDDHRGDMRGDHRGDRGDHRGPPGDMRGDHRGPDCASISEPAMRRECEEKEKSHHGGSPGMNGGDPYAKQCKEWKDKGSPAWDKHSVEHCSNK